MTSNLIPPVVRSFENLIFWLDELLANFRGIFSSVSSTLIRLNRYMGSDEVKVIDDKWTLPQDKVNSVFIWFQPVCANFVSSETCH